MLQWARQRGCPWYGLTKYPSGISFNSNSEFPSILPIPKMFTGMPNRARNCQHKRRMTLKK